MSSVSVIIPVYNAGKYLEKCVQSLFSQTLEDIEYIFVDDCSTDESMQILQNMLEQNPDKRGRVKIIKHLENKGSAAARNTGLKNTAGEYIGWVDADDWVDADMFQKMYEAAKLSKAEIVWTDFYNTYKGHENRINQQALLDSESIIRGLLQGELLGGMCNKLIDHKLFVENSLKFPEGLNMCEDLRVCVQLFYHAKSMFYLDIAPYHYIKYREDSISTSNTRSFEINKEWIENVKGIERFLTEKKWEGKMKNPLLRLKLSPKKNLLIKGADVNAYKQWRKIFPESNGYVWKTHLPLPYKMLAWCADKEIWPVVRLWLFVKYRLFNR